MASHLPCIVIGAGASGLAAGAFLAKAGHRVLILEARNRIGGRVCTERSQFPCPVDLGASFIHGVDGNPLTDIAKLSRTRLDLADHNSMTFKPDGTPLDESISSRIDSAVFDAFFTQSRETSRNDIPSPTASLGSYLLDRTSPAWRGLQSEEERGYALQYAAGLNGWTGADLTDVSFRYWGFEREFEGGDAVVVDGYNKILQTLERDIIASGGQIALSETVTAISLDEDAQLVNVTARNPLTGEPKIYAAQSCICTIPLGVLKSAEHRPRFHPALPPRRLASLERLGFGLLNKVVLAYPHVWWPKDIGYFTVLQPAPSEPISPPSDGPSALHYLSGVSVWVQSYVPITGEPLVVLYLGGTSGRAIELLGDAEATHWAHSLLESRLQSVSPSPAPAPLPSASRVTRWAADPLARGSYTYITPSRGPASADDPSPLDFVELSRPLWAGRLGFAGEHTEMDCYASVHGALLSGQREARRVKAALQGAWADVRRG